MSHAAGHSTGHEGARSGGKPHLQWVPAPLPQQRPGAVEVVCDSELIGATAAVEFGGDVWVGIHGSFSGWPGGHA